MIRFYNRLFGISVLFVGLFVASSVDAATFVVNSINDTTDGSCDVFVAGVSDCTFREAIDAANAAVGADVINFNIDVSFPDDGNGQYVVNSSSSLPNITEQLEIDASLNWDVVNDRPGIKIYNDHNSTAVNFGAASSGSKIKGLEIDSGSTVLSVNGDNSVVGTDCDGVRDAFERNVIYNSAVVGGNNKGNAYFFADNLKIRGNYFGVYSDGITPASASTSFSVRVNGDNIIFGYEEGTSGICSPVIQRNIVGSINGNGISTLAPMTNLRIQGNYIGVGVDGVANIGSNSTSPRFGIVTDSNNEGVDFLTNSYFGTDGDGIDDVYEGNVIAGWSSHQIFLYHGGKDVLIAGNIVGLSADQSTVVRGSNAAGTGITVRSENMIIGYCDVGVDAVLCSAGGTQANMRNVIGGAINDGIRLGGDAKDAKVFGNLIGVNDAGQDVGNLSNGIRSFKYDGSSVVGGLGISKRNIIRFNELNGVQMDVCDSDCTYSSALPTERYYIENNLISNNVLSGIWLDRYEESDGDPDPTDGKVLGNTITDNGEYGVNINGANPDINNNIIRNNTLDGVLVTTTYRKDFQRNDVYDNPYDALSPNNAANDAVGQPEITGNVIDNNGGGIRVLDAEPVNEATLLADNTIGVNGSYDLRKEWFVGVELLESGIPPATVATPTVNFISNAGLPCASACYGTGSDDAGGGLFIYSADSVDYNDETTWFRIVEYDYDTAAALVSYSPYRLELTGDWDNDGVPPVISVDGDASNDPDTGNLAPGITTHGIDRYQTYEVAGVLADANNHLKLNVDYSENDYVSGGPNVIGFIKIYRYDPEVVASNGFGAGSSGLPFLAFGIVYFVGHLRTRKKSVASDEEIEAVLNRRKSYFALAVIVGLVVFVSFSGLARFGFAEGYVEVGGDDVLYSGDKVRIEYFIENIGNGSAVGIELDSDISSFIVIDANSVVSENVDGDVTLEDGIVAEIGDLNQRDAASVQLDGVVMVEDGEWIINAEITGENFGAIEIASDKVVVEKKVIVNSDTSVGDESVDATDSETSDVIDDGSVDEVVASDEEAVNNKVDTGEASTPTTEFEPLTLLTGETSELVYLVDEFGLRRPFRTLVSFYSWYEDFNDVQLISDIRLYSIDAGKQVNIRPGTLLVKNNTDPFVFAVEPGGIMRWIQSEDEAIRLYGKEYADRVVDISYAMIRDFELGDPVEIGGYPDGMLVSDGDKLCYLEDGLCRLVTEEGKTANRFFDRYISYVDSSVLDGFLNGPVIDGLEFGLLFD